MIKITQKNAKMPKNDQAVILLFKRSKFMLKRSNFCKCDLKKTVFFYFICESRVEIIR